MRDKREEWNEKERLIRDLVEKILEGPPYIGSEDRKGHDVIIGARVPKWFERVITEIMETPGLPYKVRSDVVRDAVFLGLRLLTILFKGKGWEIEEAIAKVVSDAHLEMEIREEVNKLADALNKIAINDIELAVQKLREILSKVLAEENERKKKMYLLCLRENVIIRKIASYGEVVIDENS